MLEPLTHQMTYKTYFEKYIKYIKIILYIPIWNNFCHKRWKNLNIPKNLIKYYSLIFSKKKINSNYF